VDGPIAGATMNEQGTIFAFLEQKTRTYHAAELASGKVLVKRQSAFPNVRSPMFTGDGKSMIVGGSMQNRNSKITVVDLSDGKEVASREFTGFLANYHPVGETDIGFLVFQGRPLNIIWDWKTKSENVLFDGRGEQEGGINWSFRDERRGNIIANSNDYFNSPKEVNYIQVLDQKSKTLIYATQKKRGRINRFGLSPNAKYLALARNDGGVEVHDMDRLAKVWESDTGQLGAGGVQSLEFSPDGALLLATGGGRNVGLWEAVTGRLITSELKHQGSLAMAGWNQRGNAFVIASRQGEIRLYEIPNPKGSDYLPGVAMTPETTEAIAEALSNRTIEEGRIVPFTANLTNTPPELASLPTIHQYIEETQRRAWHLARARNSSNGNQWSSVKFHLDQAAAIAPLGSLEVQTLFRANLNLGHYALAEANLDRLGQKTESTEDDSSYSPDVAMGWKEDVWQYSGHHSIGDFDSGIVQEHLDQETLELEEAKTWEALQDFQPAGVQVNRGDHYVDAPENCLFYVAKTFTVEEAGFYEVVFDSDDGMKAWVNGRLVHVFSGNRGLFRPGEDVVSVWLREGLNIVVIKVVNGFMTTGFAFENRGRMDQFTALQRYHTRLATGKKTDFALPDMDNEANPDEMLELTRQAVLFKSEKPILDKLDQRVRANPKFESILDGSFLQPASYVKPKVQPTPDQLRNGFTLECFINTQQKFGVNHIISNGGSFAESGFSLLTLGGGGVVRGEFQNTATNEKILMDASYPYDNQWHHVAMTYDANKKETMLYLDGKPGTARTSYKSPLVFDPKLLRIGENELRGMGFTGGITDVRIWPKVLNAEVISKHALGEVSSADSPLVNLPLRFANAEEARQANGASGFMAQKVDWTQANQVHPMAKEQDWVFAQFRGQGFSNSEAFATLGALEYRLGNYQKALDLLIRSQNNGRYSTEVRLYPWMGGGMIDRNAAPYLIMAYKKCGYNVHYQLIRNAFNQEFNKFEMRTWEISGEPDVLERIKLKTLQREMNALADE
jgi:hypothetical protein